MDDRRDGKTLECNSLIHSLYKAFQEQEDCDITFYVKDEDIQAHKFILNLRSDVLKTMINNKLSYENDKIVIKDPEVEAEDFRQFLQYLYTDDCEISESNVKVLLHLGHMYAVPALLEKCAAFIQKNLNADDVFNYAKIGLLYSDDCSLLKKCMEYLKENDVFNNYNALYRAKVSAELVKKIVEECERSDSLTEDRLFKAVFNWAEFECKQKELEENSANYKAVIADIISFIKFEDLKAITLATTVSDNELLPEIEIFQYLRKAVIAESNAVPRLANNKESKFKNNNNRRNKWRNNRERYEPNQNEYREYRHSPENNDWYGQARNAERQNFDWDVDVHNVEGHW
uniref:BTB domain-containing protein n=1 Tax=Panagrolaimus sp. ES5 TaxID=591445 RepID=A0AC34G870_9BILA